jgi:hypothetical protein
MPYLGHFLESFTKKNFLSEIKYFKMKKIILMHVKTLPVAMHKHAFVYN